LIVILYNYIGLYISWKHGAKIQSWPSVIKSKDYTFYLIYFSYIALVINGIISTIRGSYVRVLVLSGFILTLIGMYINFISRRDLAQCWLPLSNSASDTFLIKTGIYARVRHPIYLSVLIFLLGVALIGSNFYSLLFFVTLIVALIIRIRKEENALIAKFGEEYNEYARATPILIPKIKKG